MIGLIVIVSLVFGLGLCLAVWAVAEELGHE
jgi:hypothetical protein